MMIKRILWLLATCLAGYSSQAQGGFIMSGGVNVVCSGSPSITISNGKWKNTASTFVTANSKVIFTGNASNLNSTVEGITTFYELIVNKSSNDMLLVANTTSISSKYVFDAGKLNLGGKTLSLGSSAILSSESETRRTYSALPNSRVLKTANVNNPNALNHGNMGMVFTLAGNLGSTTVDRRHTVQTLPSGNSIEKYWRVSAVNPSGWSATLRFNYFDAELNGLNEANLTIWRSVNNGVTWTDMGFLNRNNVSNFVEQSALTDVSGWWTLGEVAPAPLANPVDDRVAGEVVQLPAPDIIAAVFPNPASDFINLKLSSPFQVSTGVQLFNQAGELLRNMEIDTAVQANSICINVKNLPAGLYYFKLNGVQQAVPFVKQ